MSAKGSLKTARNPVFQALFAIRGVSANVFKLSADQIIGPKGNKEFTDLVTIMGCNAGPKFDMSKLQFNKIIIASDADVDGLFIRSMLMAFFFKMFPDIILDGRLFIAEPPLYRVDDKKDPFVINKADYINRYIKAAMKSYKIGFVKDDDKTDLLDVEYLDKNELGELLSDTSSYVTDLEMAAKHYKINDRLLEIIIEELAMMNDELIVTSETVKKINIQHLMNRIGAEFSELYYSDKDSLIKGSIDGTYQLVEITDQMINKVKPLVLTLRKWGSGNCKLILKDVKTGTEHQLSMLGALKVLKQFQPNILHRFKGLGENSDEDIRTTIMDPNTRTLIRVKITDIENDMQIFQLLRGGSAVDALNRKTMMKQYKIDKELIDT
jgi:DNA gyrase subunit B